MKNIRVFRQVTEKGRVATSDWRIVCRMIKSSVMLLNAMTRSGARKLIIEKLIIEYSVFCYYYVNWEYSGVKQSIFLVLKRPNPVILDNEWIFLGMTSDPIKVRPGQIEIHISQAIGKVQCSFRAFCIKSLTRHSLSLNELPPFLQPPLPVIGCIKVANMVVPLLDTATYESSVFTLKGHYAVVKLTSRPIFFVIVLMSLLARMCFIY